MVQLRQTASPTPAPPGPSLPCGPLAGSQELGPAGDTRAGLAEHSTALWPDVCADPVVGRTGASCWSFPFTLGRDRSSPLELQFLNGQCLQEAPTSLLFSWPETNTAFPPSFFLTPACQDGLLSSVPSVSWKSRHTGPQDRSRGFLSTLSPQASAQAACALCAGLRTWPPRTRPSLRQNGSHCGPEGGSG